MYIEKVYIKNFKCFTDFNISLSDGLNILVGDNEAGKSTILEAIHLVLTGLLNGKYLKNELSQYLFNNEIVAEYLKNLQDADVANRAYLPYITIEIFLGGNDAPELEGNDNTERKNACGLYYKIEFDEEYKTEYEEFIRNNTDISTIPIEYYKVTWKSFARAPITSRSIAMKSALIDSSSNRYQNGSDIYISRIVRDFLEPKEIVDISQAHRKMKEIFMEQPAIQDINNKIKMATKISGKDVTLSVDLSSKSAWENSLLTYLNDVPFHQIGKGEQCIIKTKLALEHKKSKEANVILLEEPENHLSHTKLNQLIYDIKRKCIEKQIIISTHNSFVANKLGLGNLVLLNNKETTRFKNLQPETKVFFEKISGYDTLRLILCEKAILVEGDSDELIVQKAYMLNNDGKLPIEDSIDVISVGTSFLRFLEIAEKLNKPAIVVTDNDGNVEALKKKFEKYLVNNAPTKEYIKICFDETVDKGDLQIDDKPFNYNTLEPKICKENNLSKLNTILGTSYTKINDLHKYMKKNKTECALKIFDNTTEIINFPQYILKAIQ